MNGEDEESKKNVVREDVWCKVEFQLPDILLKGENSDIENVGDEIVEAYKRSLEA